MKESLEQFIKSISNLHPRINFITEFSTDENHIPRCMFIQRERFDKNMEKEDTDERP